MILACALAAALVGIAPSSALASINGDDYVGLTAVNDRGLNITEAPAIDAKYGILCDAEGNVLWSRSADTHSAMASLTKTMTAIVALENANLDDVFTVSKKAASIGESTTGLKEGMQVPLETLLNGMLVHSGNDCAITIAEGVGGD
ncbi:MAG: D-alanyl-D-alanine carboxypeptidase family protein, partial [Coriobacteriales bacterium]